MQIKEGIGWKSCFNEEKGVYGAEIVFQGSWYLYEISADAYNSLSNGMKGSEAEKLIGEGRRLYMHVNDTCGPGYNVTLDENYADFCPWMKESDPVGKTWDKDLTDAAAEVFGIEKREK